MADHGDHQHREDRDDIFVFHSARSNVAFPEKRELAKQNRDHDRAEAEKAKALTSAERRILGYYIDGYEATDIPDLAYISIHTVKKHNHSIYQKLEVSSRDELMLYIEMFRCCGRLDELIGQEQVTEL